MGSNTKSQPQLYLFEVNAGAVYWVAAHEAKDCVALIEAVDVPNLVEEYGSEPEVAYYDMARASGHLVWDDNDGRQRTMLSFFEDAYGPGVIACSEW